MKTKLVISFSGGETSAYMTNWLLTHKQDEYEMIVVFANTGQENEETLDFVRKCDIEYGFNTVWIEAIVNPVSGKGTKHKIVDYFSANRDGKHFEDVIKKYGIPNTSVPHCTREMKQAPITSYSRSIGWKGYYTAIGIRVDENHRAKPKTCALKLLYPLIDMQPMTKPKINFWWSQQPFRLELKGYQGNCKTCWKKSDNKLYQLAKEDEHLFDFFRKMELRYDRFVPPTVVALMAQDGRTPTIPVRFFRGNRAVSDIVNASRLFTKEVLDDAMQFDENESCEVFTKCGEQLPIF